MVTSVDVYKEIRRLQLDGVSSQRAAAQMLGISRNTVKKYWQGESVPWERQTYEREPAVLTPEVIQFIQSCLDEDEKEQVHRYCQALCANSSSVMVEPGSVEAEQAFGMFGLAADQQSAGWPSRVAEPLAKPLTGSRRSATYTGSAAASSCFSLSAISRDFMLM